MAAQFKSLKDMRKEAKACGVGVRAWSAKAGLPWQSIYRKLKDPKHLTVDEHQRLERALEQIKAEAGRPA